VILKVSM